MNSSGKCDARGCGSPAQVTTKFGARYCYGHKYLAEPRASAVGGALPDPAGSREGEQP